MRIFIKMNMKIIMGTNELKKIYDEAIEDEVQGVLDRLADRVPTNLTHQECIELIREVKMKELSKYIFCRY